MAQEAKRRNELIAAIRKDWEAMHPPREYTGSDGFEHVTDNPQMAEFQRRARELRVEIGDHPGEAAHRKRWFGSFKSWIEFALTAALRRQHQAAWRRIQDNLAKLGKVMG